MSVVRSSGCKTPDNVCQGTTLVVPVETGKGEGLAPEVRGRGFCNRYYGQQTSFQILKRQSSILQILPRPFVQNIKTPHA